jgi:hypothetical protein
MDIIEHFPGRVALGQTLHEIDELASHRSPWETRRFMEILLRLM